MKILMVGLGGIGQRHVRNLRAVLGADLELFAFRVRRNAVTLTDQLGVEPATDVEQKYNIRVYTDLDEALAYKPDAVFVCNPSSLHVPIALRAADAGCHLFIEKPLSHSLEQVDALLDIVARRQRVALVGYQLRFHPCLLRLYELLQQRAVGRVLSVRVSVGEYLPGWHTYEDYRAMYASRRDLGGGVIVSQIHELDYLYWLLGMPRRLFAVGGQLSHLEIDVEDVASILMEYVVDGQKIPVHVHQDYVQRPPERSCQIIGDAGKILMDLRNPTVQLFDGQGACVETTAFPEFQRNQLFVDQVKHFLACVRGEQTPRVSLHDSVQSLRIALAAQESLATGQIVAFTE